VRSLGALLSAERRTILMGSVGPGELLIIALIALLLFGAGRIADIGKGLGQGIRNFKEGLREEDQPKRLEEKNATSSADKKEKEA
jgi:sec-independent protein translocase protein TatA